MVTTLLASWSGCYPFRYNNVAQPRTRLTLWFAPCFFSTNPRKSSMLNPLNSLNWPIFTVSPSEKAFVDRVFGSVEQAFEDDRQARQLAAKWRMGRIDITKHPRARSFEEIVRLPWSPFKTERRLEEVLHDYKYPYMEQRLITPAAYRQLKRWLQDKNRNSARLRQQRSRALRATQPLLPAKEKRENSSPFLH